MAKTATPWGPAELVEELILAQRAGEKRFSSVVQLLEAPGGERLVRFAFTTGGPAPPGAGAPRGQRRVRFAYTTGGSPRRGPVTLRGRDLDRLRQGLAKRPALAEALGLK